MFSSYLAWRYLNGNKGHFIVNMMTNFTIVILTIVIAVLIVVLSFTNGFNRSVIDDLVNINGHAQILVKKSNSNKSELYDIYKDLNSFDSVAKYHYGNSRYTIIGNQDFSSLHGVYIYGLDLPKKHGVSKVKSLDNYILNNVDGEINGDKIDGIGLVLDNKYVDKCDKVDCESKCDKIDSVNRCGKVDSRLQCDKIDSKSKCHKILENNNKLAKEFDIFSSIDIVEGDKAIAYDGILISEKMARRINCKVGDEVSLIGRNCTESMIGMIPQIQRCIVNGIFTSDNDRLNNFTVLTQRNGICFDGIDDNYVYVFMKNPFENVVEDFRSLNNNAVVKKYIIDEHMCSASCHMHSDRSGNQNNDEKIDENSDRGSGDIGKENVYKHCVKHIENQQNQIENHRDHMENQNQIENHRDHMENQNQIENHRDHMENQIENHRDHMENQIENHRDHMENQIENQRDQIENQRDHMENRALNYENVINSIQHWSQQYVSFFNMLMLESRIMKIVILMIVCIFALLIVVSIVLIIYEKKKDIAVLISAGMTRWQVASVFCLIGVYICILSSILGCILGYVILTNFSIILSCLEYFLGGIYDISIGIDFIFPYIEMFYIIMSMVILNIFMVLIVSYIMFNRSLHMIIRG